VRDICGGGNRQKRIGKNFSPDTSCLGEKKEEERSGRKRRGGHTGQMGKTDPDERSLEREKRQREYEELTWGRKRSSEKTTTTKSAKRVGMS